MNNLIKKIHRQSKEKGFWDKERNIGELLMLVVSELAEALEAHRKGNIFGDHHRVVTFSTYVKNNFSNKKTFPEQFEILMKDTFEDEIADAVIRLMDLCGGLGINLKKHIELKLRYNATRPRLHGKRY